MKDHDKHWSELVHGTNEMPQLVLRDPCTIKELLESEEKLCLWKKRSLCEPPSVQRFIVEMGKTALHNAVLMNNLQHCNPS